MGLGPGKGGNLVPVIWVSLLQIVANAAVKLERGILQELAGLRQGQLIVDFDYFMVLVLDLLLAWHLDRFLRVIGEGADAQGVAVRLQKLLVRVVVGIGLAEVLLDRVGCLDGFIGLLVQGYLGFDFTVFAHDLESPLLVVF